MAFKNFLLHTLKRKVNGGIYEIPQIPSPYFLCSSKSYVTATRTFMQFQERYLLIFEKNLFFYLDFFHRHSLFKGQQWKEEAINNSSLLLPPASKRLRYQPGDYCRQFISAKVTGVMVNYKTSQIYDSPSPNSPVKQDSSNFNFPVK